MCFIGDFTHIFNSKAIHGKGIFFHISIAFNYGFFQVIIEDCYLTSMEMVENKPKDWETYPEWQEMFEIYENIENTYYLR